MKLVKGVKRNFRSFQWRREALRRQEKYGLRNRQGDGQLRRLYRLSLANFTGILKSRRRKMPRFALRKAKPRNIPIWGKRGLPDLGLGRSTPEQDLASYHDCLS